MINSRYFISYLYNDNKVELLHVIVTEKWMYFLIEDDDLLEKYNTFWDKVKADIQK